MRRIHRLAPSRHFHTGVLHGTFARATLWAVVLLLVGTLSGCIGTFANLVHVAKGNVNPPNYTGLKGKRIAVVCVSNSEAFGPAEASMALAKHVGKLIQKNVSEVTIIEQRQIDEWIDRNDWDYTDYQAVGQGVEAEMVVAIDLDGFSLHEGKTLYKGRADVQVVVYDMTKGGEEVFTYAPPQIQYPENTGHPTTDMTERAFRNDFLSVVASRIARQFYAYDMKEDFARDSSIIRAR